MPTPSLKTQLAVCGIHEHWNPGLAELNIVLTDPGQPAPSPDTEITIQHHIFVPGRILEDHVILTDDTGDGPTDYKFNVQDQHSVLSLACQLEDNIIMMQ